VITILPARIAASQTYSSVSDSPLRIGVMILGRWGWKRVPKVAGRKTNKDINPSLMVLRGDWAFEIMSGSRPSSLSIPRPERTSLRPCAAPWRSTPDESVFNVLIRLGTRSGKLISPRRSTKVPSVLAAVARASGTGSTRTT
jgi:hypothetical protein